MAQSSKNRRSKKRDTAKRNKGWGVVLISRREPFKRDSWEMSVRRREFFTTFGSSNKPAKFSSRHKFTDAEERDRTADGFFSVA